jgi:hypothetical protein
LSAFFFYFVRQMLHLLAIEATVKIWNSQTHEW